MVKPAGVPFGWFGVDQLIVDTRCLHYWRRVMPNRKTAIQSEAILRFIKLCRKTGWPEVLILDQLERFTIGERGISLSDNCMVLLDGTLTMIGENKWNPNG